MAIIPSPRRRAKGAERGVKGHVCAVLARYSFARCTQRASPLEWRPYDGRLLPLAKGTPHTVDVRTIAIGSTNDAKVRAVRWAASRVWPGVTYHPVEVPSGVSEMPMSDEEGARGALTRAQRARQTVDADLGVGLEGSVVDGSHGMYLTGWVAVVDRRGRTGLASGARIPLPEIIARRLRAGEELGPVIDALSGRQDSKQHEGAAGYLTRGLLPRHLAFGVAVLCALAPFLREDLYAERPTQP